jgi:transcriptional regulator with XRE-family HTH domain
MVNRFRTKYAIEPAQCRAARGLINWSRNRLAEASGVPSRTVADFELGNTEPRTTTANKLLAALDAAGVELIAENGGGPGVRLKKAQA